MHTLVCVQRPEGEVRYPGLSLCFILLRQSFIKPEAWSFQLDWLVSKLQQSFCLCPLTHMVSLQQ